MSSMKKTNLPKSVKDLSKEQLTEILRKKKLCNARALRIVETSIEQHVDEQWLLPNLVYINQSHYDDIIDERFILKYCGYPICSNPLGEIPKQQYKISLSSKTVYHLTERKKFCSPLCFKSSEYLKSQLLTSPLWFRENETIPNFKLFKEEKVSRQDDESSNNAQLDVRMEEPDGREKKNVENKSELVSERNEQPMVLPLCRKRKVEKMEVEVLDPVQNVERIIKEWFTIDTFAYLFGEEELKRKFHGKEEILMSCVKESDDVKRFEDISKLFSILNLDGEEREIQELKPLPDYSALRNEAKKMNIKIRAFYTGQLDMPGEATAAGESEGSGLSGELPLVDSKAQTALRRKVLLDQLNKKVPEMCVCLDLGDIVKIGDSRCLVRTFFLSAHNVTMKPREWSLAAVIFLKMLAFKIEDLSVNFHRDTPKLHTRVLLRSFNLADDYLDNFITYLTDADRLMQSFEHKCEIRKQDMY